jgi:hypothetical protein
VSRAVVAALLVLAAVAVADAVRPPAGGRPEPAPARSTRGDVETSVFARPAGSRLDLVRSTRAGFRPAGGYLQTHVLQSGRVVLPRRAIERAFPDGIRGRVDVKDVALSPDGTLVVVVFRFPLGAPARAALEFWRRRKLVAAFAVAPAMLRGGLGFSRDGKLVAAFSPDGRRATLFDRRGNALGEVPL